MKLETTDLTPHVGAELKTDKQTLLDGSLGGEIRRLLEKRGVLIARGIDFEDRELVAFAKTLGTVRLGTVKSEGVDGILKVTLDESENPAYAEYLYGTFYWHMDGPYDAIPPLATILTPRVLSPSGGQTEFASTYAAFEALPRDEQEQLEQLTVVHTVEAHHRTYNKNPDQRTLDWWHSFPAREHPLVWKHESGRKSLVLGVSCDHVVGMDRSDSDALIARLIEWTTRPEFVYQHDWQPADVLIWDNTGTMHRALPYQLDCGRLLHRVTLEGEEALASADG